MLRSLAACFFMLATSAALAADATVQRKIYDRMDVPAGYETVIGSAEIPPGVSLGAHTHTGVEFGYVTEGEIEFLIKGKEPYRIKAGGFYKIDAGAVHDAHAVGGSGTVVATWVVEKGKPFSEPAK